MSDQWDEIFSTPQIEEEFDPTWPYNFKWAYDSQTGQTDVWRVMGGTDGRPTHRSEVRNRWGRDPRVTEGDVMGLAVYIPAEMKFSGEVVAPPEVHTQTYYNQPTPPSVTQYFQQQFPHAIVRDAVVVPKRLGKVAADEWNFEPTEPKSEVLKWVFNRKSGLLVWEATGEDGLPTHQQKVMAEWGRHMTLTSDWDAINGQDEIGYAYPSTELVELQRWDYKPISPEALSALRKQLSEWYPHAQVVDEYGASPDSFGTDPKDWHSAAVNWAWETLPNEPSDRSESDFAATERTRRGLTRLFSKKPVWKKTAEADMEGCMVALFLGEADAKKLKVRGGEPIENMHITLCYFSDKQADRDDWDEVKKIVEQIANQSPPMSGKVSGYGVFNSPDGDVLWASPSVQGLAELRHKIYEACEDAGFHIDTEHDWVPHITLKYNHKGKLPRNKGHEIEFENLSFAQGGDHDHYELKGNLEKTTSAPTEPPNYRDQEKLDEACKLCKMMWKGECWGYGNKPVQPDKVCDSFTPDTAKTSAEDYLDWGGWEGSHRFVTDGSELMKEPETETIDPSRWRHNQLEKDFREFFPDTKSTVSGWTVPTADGLGLGIYAPGVGLGDKHEPGPHEIVALVEDEFGKPAHFITNGDHLQDPKMYHQLADVEPEWQTT